MSRWDLDEGAFRAAVSRLREEHVHPDDRDAVGGRLRRVDVCDAETHRVLFSRRLVFDADVLSWGEARWKAWLESSVLAAVLPIWFWNAKTEARREVYACSEAARGRRLASAFVPIQASADDGGSPQVSDVRRYELDDSPYVRAALDVLGQVAPSHSCRFDVSYDSLAPGRVLLDTSLSHDLIVAYMSDAVQGWGARPGGVRF